MITKAQHHALRTELAELRKQYKLEVIRANQAEAEVQRLKHRHQDYLSIYRELLKDRELLTKIYTQIHTREKQQQPIPGNAGL